MIDYVFERDRESGSDCLFLRERERERERERKVVCLLEREIVYLGSA